ncbi:rod-binding protein [Rhodobacter viridis]
MREQSEIGSIGAIPMDIRAVTAAATSAASDGKAKDEAALRHKAQDLEASFLAEMLKYTGLGKSEGGFDGGVGEEQFSSFLVDEYANKMVKAGGIGLAESIFKSLQKGAEHAE